MMKFYEAFAQSQFEPLRSFTLHKELNPEIWTSDEKIDEDIADQLIQIAEDYFEELELDGVVLEDIILTGSLANYNWSKYSDFDLHLLFDFSEVNDDIELVRKFTDVKSKMFNKEHDIKIRGYEVEIYCQHIEDPHVSTGQYSLINDEWIVKPSPQNFQIDQELIRKKAEKIMSQIQDLEKDLERGESFNKINKQFKKIWDKIKVGRKSGLAKEGEFSIENLVFKFLRRNEYITRLLEVKKRAYDNQFK